MMHDGMMGIGPIGLLAVIALAFAMVVLVKYLFSERK